MFTYPTARAGDPQHDTSPRVTDGGVGLQIWRLSANILNKQSWTADQEWSTSWGFGARLTTLHSKNKVCSETSTGPRNSTDN